MAATEAMAGFASGGYTVDGSPGQVPGFVHDGEFVWSAQAVRNIGLDNLERAHTAARGFSPSAGGAKGSSRNRTTFISTVTPPRRCRRP
jgi:phage-related minor tail protein